MGELLSPYLTVLCKKIQRCNDVLGDISWVQNNEIQEHNEYVKILFLEKILFTEKSWTFVLSIYSSDVTLYTIPSFFLTPLPLE